MLTCFPQSRHRSTQRTLTVAVGLLLGGIGGTLVLSTQALAQRTASAEATAASRTKAPGLLTAVAATATALAGDRAAAAAADASRAAGALPRTTQAIIDSAPPEAWREPDPQNVMVLELRVATQPEPAQVIIELASRFAPAHVRNIRALVRGGYFDGLSVVRVQDNYVAQWGDTARGSAARALPPAAQTTLPAEFDVPLAGLPFHALRETDGWAGLNGYVDGFPVAADPSTTAQGRAWIAHCYGNVGAGRGNAFDSSKGNSLYAVIGQATRWLDLNITSVGRVLFGIEHLSSLPRGTQALGFLSPSQHKPPLLRARLLADVPVPERPMVKVLRTNTPTWFAMVHSLGNRSGWFVHNPGRVDLCSITVPVRVTAPTAR